MTPPVVSIHQRDTHRLIPARYGDESVLRRLAATDAEFDNLIGLDSATNDRLLGEANRLPGIGVHELLFGVPHAAVVNATFTHAHPLGSRFNDADRGAWYAGFELKTAQAEVAFHKGVEMQEIAWPERETFVYDDYLADFHADFHDLRSVSPRSRVLAPDTYKDSQTLGRTLLAAGSVGIVYPSVRRSSGTCLVCFRPALVSHVRQGDTLSLEYRTGPRLTWH